LAISLRGDQRDLVVADIAVQAVLDAVFGIGDLARLGPQVARVVGSPAQLEADEMVVFVVRGRSAVAVGGDAGDLLDVGDAARRTDRRAVALDADRRIDR
jgi:hypothetical protein